MAIAHCIHRQVLELGVASSAEAPAIQARARSAWQEKLVPALEGAFSCRSGENEWIVLERLELDLGRIGLPDLEAELASRLQERLGPALDAELAGARRDSDGRRGARIFTAQDLRLAWLRAYLESGGVPFELAGSRLATSPMAGSQPGTSDGFGLGFDAAPVVEALLAEDAPALLALLRDAPAPSTARRLVAQLPASLLRRLLAALEPRRAPAFLELVAHCRTLVASGQSEGVTRPAGAGADSDSAFTPAGTEDAAMATLFERLLAEAAGSIPSRELALGLLRRSFAPLDPPTIGKLARRARRTLPASSELRRQLEAEAQRMGVPSPADPVSTVDRRSERSVSADGETPRLSESTADRDGASSAERPRRPQPVAGPGADAGDEDASTKRDSPRLTRSATERRGPMSDPRWRSESSGLESTAEPESKARLPLDLPFDRAEPLHVTDAGLVLLAPFLPRFLRAVGLLEGADFPRPHARARAVQLLHHLATGRKDLPEARLVLDKTLCGWPAGAALPRRFEPTEKETEECRRLLESVIDHWRAVGRTSVEGLQSSFLERAGRLSPLGDEGGRGFRLEVERAAYDVLLERLPWAMSPVALPFMKAPIFVEW